MVETGLAVVFGFVAALFLVLLIAPAVARRISALTWRQATRVLPQSSEEIAAGRDHLRGLGAIELRKLEIRLEAVSEKERALRIGKQGLETQISTLTDTGKRLEAEVTGLKAENTELNRDLNLAVESNALLTTQAADGDVQLANLGSDIAKLRSDHSRLTAAFASLEEARQLGEQKRDLMQSEAAAMRSKLSVAESEVRIARTEVRRQDGDLKLANRKIASLESKLERSIRTTAEAEERLDRREAELKRLKEAARPQWATTPASLPRTASPSPRLKPIPVERLTVENIAAPIKADALPMPVPPTQLEAIAAEIDRLRPALRLAPSASGEEKARLKAEMMALAGRVTAEAALDNPNLRAKVSTLQAGVSTLADEIIRSSKEVISS